MSQTSKPRRVVYTALIGGIESLQELGFKPNSEISYICFTDQEGLTSESWEIVRVKPRVPGDSARSTRHLKFIGHPLLERFDEWLWIDNRVLLHDYPARIFEALSEGFELCFALHDHRETVRDEFEAVLEFRKDHPFRVLETLQFVTQIAPEVLAERPFAGTIILRRNSQQVTQFMEAWFETVLRFSSRDQLSLNALLRHHGIAVGRLPFSVSGSHLHSYISGGRLGRSFSGINLKRFPTTRAVIWSLVSSSLVSRRLKRVLRAFKRKGAPARLPDVLFRR